jgi:hypothetical protein
LVKYTTNFIAQARACVIHTLDRMERIFSVLSRTQAKLFSGADYLTLMSKVVVSLV